MLQSRTKQIPGFKLLCLLALALAIVGFGLRAQGQGIRKNKAVPAEQVITSIRTAISAKPGDVRAVKIENEDGKTICEVKILAQDGKTYEVEVDVATNTVVE